jgi:hypothetical protein
MNTYEVSYKTYDGANKMLTESSEVVTAASKKGAIGKVSHLLRFLRYSIGVVSLINRS